MNSTAMRTAALLVLGLGLQGALAQSPRWEREIAAFEQADRTSPRPHVQVLFYGSSSFRLWSDLQAAFPGVDLLNRGFGGSELSDLIEFVDRVVIPHAPRLLLIYGGDNDIAAGKSAEVVLHDFEELVKRVRSALPRTRIAFVSVKPSPSREKFLPIQQEANASVRRFAQTHRRVDYIDAATPLLTRNGRPDPRLFRADRLHLNQDGYDIWRRILGKYLHRGDR